MEKIRVLIVEDQSLVAEATAAILRKHSFEVVAICATGEEAVRLCRSQPPDLVIMDIQLQGALDGISTAQVIQSDYPILVIYLSDYDDAKTVDRAKQTHPANYLSKPFNENELIRAVDIAVANAQVMPNKQMSSSNHVLLRTDTQNYIKLDYKEILFLKADRSYCNVITLAQEFKLSTSMNHVHEQLGRPEFVRISRSFVVNVTKVDRLNGNMICLGKHEIQMSKEYRDAFMQMQKIIK